MNLSTLFFLRSRDKDLSQSLTKDIKINFYPFKPQMSKEIERCIASGQFETLKSFCSSCIFNISLKRKEPECKTCYVSEGIEKTIRKETKKEEGASPLTRVSSQP